MTEVNGTDVITAVKGLVVQFAELKKCIQEQFEQHTENEMEELQQLREEIQTLRRQYERMTAVIAVHNEDYSAAISEMQTHKTLVDNIAKKLMVLDLVAQAMRTAENL